MSNALYSPPGTGAWGQVLAALAQAADGPDPAGAPPFMHPAMVTLVAIGCCVLVVWLVRRLARPAKLSLRNTPGRANHVNPVHVVGGLVAMWLAAQGTYLGLGKLFADPLADEAAKAAAEARHQVAAGLVGSSVWLIAGLVIAAFTFRHGLRRGLGLSGRRWLYDNVRGVLSYLTVLPICTGLVIATSYLFVLLDLPLQYHPVLKGLPGFSMTWKALAVFSTVAVAPLAEEVFFRGLVQSMIRQYVQSPWLAILGGSALFAAVHFNQPQAVPSLFALAVALGYNYERTGRLYAPILIHAIFNAVNLAVWRVP